MNCDRNIAIKTICKCLGASHVQIPDLLLFEINTLGDSRTPSRSCRNVALSVYSSLTDYQSHMTLHWLCWQKAHAFINITLNLSDTLLLDKWKETVRGSMQISHGDAFGDSLRFMTRPQHHHAKICSTCIPLWWYSAQMLLLFGHLLLHLRKRRICDLPGGIRQWHQQW